MTQWTQEDYEKLSRKVADRFSLDNDAGKMFEDYGDGGYTNWLHDDWHAIMELCVKHGVDISHLSHHGFCNILKNTRLDIIKYADHSNDKSLSERVARLLALLEVEI